VIASRRIQLGLSETIMTIDKETVAKIAGLARIKVPEADQAVLAEELSNIMGWI
jgi:aspartyl-tRNA(Asn)/glutamyl-tRNA(Gln) amidotransferase subunit C